MKKLFFMIALAAISFGSVYAHSISGPVKASMQIDTAKKKKPSKKPMKKDTTKKKDTLIKQL
jgi:hypothetical protein